MLHDAHPGRARSTRRPDRGQGLQRAPAPGLTGIVLELVGAGESRRWGMRDRARTLPSSSTATAFTAVVPMSMPTVTEPDTAVIIRPLWMTSQPRGRIEGGQPPSGARHRPGTRARTRASARTRRPGHRSLDRPAAHPHLQRRAAGRTGRRRRGHHPHRRGRLAARARSSTCPSWPWPAPGATPPTWTWPPPPPPACPCCGRRPATPTPWPRLGVALLLAANRGVVRADADVRAGETYRDGTIPYQRFRAWQLAGRTAGHRRPRRRGAGPASGASRASGMRVVPSDPYAPDATHSLDDLLEISDVVSLHAPVTPETDGDDRRRPVRGHARRGHLPQHGAGPAPRRRRPGRGAAVGQGGRRRSRPLRGRAPGHRPSAHHVPQRRARSRTSAAPPTTPRPTAPRPSPKTCVRLRAGVTPRHIVNPEVLERSAAPAAAR